MLSIVVCLVSGAILSLAFPKANLHWLAWFALSPLMYYVYRMGWKRALACGLAFGIGFFASLLYWIAIFGKFPWIALAVFQSLYVVAFVALAKLIGSRRGPWGRFLLLPPLWVTLEWMRSLGMLGFTWGDIGYSQYKVLPVIQISSVAGVWGVSFLLALSNTALANLATAHRKSGKIETGRAQVVLVGVIILALATFGSISAYRHRPRTGETIHVAVVQGNIDQDVVEDLEYVERTWRTYQDMTMAAAEEGADLIVWPETVVPGYLGLDPAIQRRLAEIASDADARLLVGGLDENTDGRVLNSAFLLSSEGLMDRYSKVHLVPFGEFVPARRYLPFLRYYMVRPYDLASGPGYYPLDAGDYMVGTAICFESTFPGIVRRLTAAGAELLCVITYDAWFGRTAAAEQHMAKSVFRAVENRRYLIRGAGTGISCIIDPAGRITAHSGLFQEAVIRSDVRTRTELTFYTRHGDWIVYTSIILIALMALPVLAACQSRGNSPRREDG